MGRKIGMREFRKNYKLQLLNYSTENYHPGHRVDFGLIVNNNRFQVKEESIVRELGIDNAKERSMAQELKEITKSDAGFAGLEISRDFLIDADLDIPSIEFDLRGKVDIDKVTKMSFDNVQVREITDSDLRDEIEDLMEDVREGRGREWRKLKRKGIALKFFYAGDVSIEVEKKLDFDLGASVNVEEIELEVGAEGNSNTNYKYSFGSSNCPFAVYFESVREFIE